MTITQKSSVIVISLAILVGLVCNAIWLGEILQIKGWAGLSWLEGYMYSIFAIIPLMVTTFLVSLRMFVRIKWSNLLIAFIALSIISFLAYELARLLLYMLYSRFFGIAYSQSTLLTRIVIGASLPIILYSYGYYFVINSVLIKIPVWTNFLFLATIFLCLAMGMLTINIQPGYGSGTNFVDAVKMGYPIFWLNVLLGLTAIVIGWMKNARSETF